MSKSDRTITCPICKVQAGWSQNPFRPFCSERCRLIDLGTWASEGYRIPGGAKADVEPGPEEKKRTPK